MENIPDTIGIDSPTLDQTVQHQTVREGHDRIGSIGQIQIWFDFAGALPFLQKAVEQLVELLARISFDRLQPGDMLAFQEPFDPKPDENAVILAQQPAQAIEGFFELDHDWIIHLVGCRENRETLFVDRFQHRNEQIFFALKVDVDSAFAQFKRLTDLVDRGLPVSILSENLGCASYDPFFLCLFVLG